MIRGTSSARPNCSRRVCRNRSGRPISDKVSVTRHSLADLRLEERDYGRAERLYRKSLADFSLEGERHVLFYSLAGLAATAAAAGNIERAGRLWGAVEHFEEERTVRLTPSERARYQRLLGQSIKKGLTSRSHAAAG